jgi:2-hydroxychromene-2-carboxylate isomerase
VTDNAAHVEPHPFTAPLTVCVDVGHPQCYLALAPVCALADELGIDVDWLPFPVPPVKRPPEPTGVERTDRGTRHRHVRARYQDADLLRYAAVQGLTVRRLDRAPDTTLASLGLLWLSHRAPGRRADYLRRLAAGHWEERLDIEDPAAVAAILQSMQQDAAAFAAFAAGSGPAELAMLRDNLVAGGVFTVPSLVVDGEVYVGRAHLPMARWVLTGRSGPPPV